MTTEEWFGLLACEVRQLYVALKNEGFNSDQALELTNTLLLKADLSRPVTVNRDELLRRFRKTTQDRKEQLKEKNNA